jgi:hypothetical protein
MRMLVITLCLGAWASTALGQDGYKVSVLKEASPASVSEEVRKATNAEGYRIVDAQGQTFADIWLRKAVPSSEKPSGPKEAIQFPFLADGELLGVIRFASEGHDYRDQSIAKGVYTLRYGLQPVNGDHLGVSTYRDYSLILPAGKDQSLALLARKQLEVGSAQSAGTSHPAVFLLLEAPADASKSQPAMIRDAEKNTWSVVFPLSLQVKGQGETIVLPVRLVVVGAAPI